ncbi:MAG: exodeoxyribonuclease VII large subunit [Saprospiraceae bacterium]
MESYSLFQVNEYIRRVIALNFREPLWIEAEIVQAKESRGNYYIELIEKEEEGSKVIAQANAVVWRRNFGFIKKKIGDLIFDLLQDGTQIRLKCRIDFNERYGLKLVIEDIDPNYTFGKLELKRQQIINQLEEEGLMEINKSLLIPDVVQRIAVISSATAAGYQDFVKQLTNNPYGFTYKVDLYDTAVQGVNVERDAAEAIEQIANNSEYYHAAAIIRGGGSKLDLSGYDNYAIAKSIAISDVPFIIGIGHDIDSTVVDLVSCLSLKTPTAVADYLVERNAHFESYCVQLSQSFQANALKTMKDQDLLIRSLEDRLSYLGKDNLRTTQGALDQLSQQLQLLSGRLLKDENHLLEKVDLAIESRDPEQILKRGYAYMKRGKETITTAAQLEKKDTVNVTFHDGTVKATIN